jgi:hypothetical protein
MNNEKDKLLDTNSKEKKGINAEADRVRSELQKQIDELKR